VTSDISSGNRPPAQAINQCKVDVIEFAPRDVQRVADEKYRGDTDKVPTTPVGSLTYLGVNLQSRYAKAHEYRDMMKIVDFLQAMLISDIDELVSQIFCDSKLGSSYYITTQHERRPEIIDYLWYRCEEIGPLVLGHNGITIDADGAYFEIEPFWNDGDLSLETEGIE
jgi:hypothetical protein